MNMEIGGPSGEIIVSQQAPLLEYGLPSQADRQRAEIAASFIAAGNGAPIIRGVGIAPERKAGLKAGPSVVVVCYSSDPDKQMAWGADAPTKKNEVAKELKRRLRGGSLKNFARNIEPDTPLFQDPLAVEYDTKLAISGWKEDANKPALVLVRDRKTGTLTTYALCWTKEEADKMMDVWGMQQKNEAVGEPTFSTLNVGRKPKETGEPVLPTSARKTLAREALHHLHTVFQHVGQNRHKSN